MDNDYKVRLGRLETLVDRMARRKERTPKIMIAPIAFSSYVLQPDETGLLMKFLFPISGKLSRVMVKIGSWEGEKRTAEFEAKLISDNGNKSFNILITPNTHPVDPKLQIQEGDRLILTCLTPEVKIKDIYAGGLIDITPNKARFVEIEDAGI